MTKAKLLWISSQEASKRIETKIPEGIDGSKVLLTGIIGGRVSVRGRIGTIKRHYNDLEVKRSITEWQIASRPLQSFLRAKDSPPLASAIDHAENWGTLDDNYLILLPEAEGQPYRLLADLEVREKDIDFFLNRHLDWSATGSDGRPRDTRRWRALMGALLQLEREGSLSSINFQTEKELREYLLLKTNEVFDERTIREDIRWIYERFVEGHAPDNGRRLPKDDETH